ncbi:MAG: response regulator transcription factor [Deltaproteobacteria bacterium]|nr:response regulator transcription factor [Deltaproteobacteria bacterium]
MKVLVAEDDANIRKGLVDILEGEGYRTVEAADGTEALAVFDREVPDLVLLDIMMPGRSGYDVCREVRRRGSEAPIIFVSAKSEEIDKVVGLELGGDDFVVKPFGVREVVARIRAVTRRCFARRPHVDLPAPFAIGDLDVSPAELRARRGDVAIDLSLREVRILDLLARNRGRVLDRDTLFNHCWGLNYFPASRTLDQHISRLRKRIELDPANPRIIRTVHGLGYRYDG